MKMGPKPRVGKGWGHELAKCLAIRADHGNLYTNSVKSFQIWAWKDELAKLRQECVELTDRLGDVEKELSATKKRDVSATASSIGALRPKYVQNVWGTGGRCARSQT